MKKLAALILTGVMALGCFGTVFGAETKVSVDGVPVAFTDAKPFVDENGRTMVPLRPIANAMGLEVAWDAEMQTAAFTMDLPNAVLENPENVDNFLGIADFLRYGKDMGFDQISATAFFTIGESDYYAVFSGMWENGEPFAEGAGVFPMDTVPVVKDGRTYAPARYLAEAFGYDVGWNGATSTVIISNK